MILYQNFDNIDISVLSRSDSIKEDFQIEKGKIIALIEKPPLMKKMSENNLQEAKDKYGAKVVVKDIEEIYLSLFYIKRSREKSN